VELQKLYRAMHDEGEAFLGIPASDTFPGKSLVPQAARIKPLIARCGAQTILDYGSGKGKQYETTSVVDETGRRWPSMMDYWNVEEVVCYDPCYKPFSELPKGRFDGVISTDVLEHCPEEDIPWIVEEMFGFAERLVFANVASFPARKRLPNGENAHCTIRPAPWWQELLEAIAARHPGVKWEVWISNREGDDSPIKLGNT
jgi:hypothetical protein